MNSLTTQNHDEFAWTYFLNFYWIPLHFYHWFPLCFTVVYITVKYIVFLELFFLFQIHCIDQFSSKCIHEANENIFRLWLLAIFILNDLSNCKFKVRCASDTVAYLSSPIFSMNVNNLQFLKGRGHRFLWMCKVLYIIYLRLCLLMTSLYFLPIAQIMLVVNIFRLSPLFKLICKDLTKLISLPLPDPDFFSPYKIYSE